MAGQEPIAIVPIHIGLAIRTGPVVFGRIEVVAFQFPVDMKSDTVYRRFGTIDEGVAVKYVVDTESSLPVQVLIPRRANHPIRRVV